jgi:hypothetical protein
MNAVDTNILIYVNDPRDPAKQVIAASLVSAQGKRKKTIEKLGYQLKPGQVDRTRDWAVVTKKTV